MVQTKVVAAAALVLLACSCSQTFTWTKYDMDGHRTGVTAPSADNVAEALDLIRRVGPREAYLTHMSHGIGRHAETEPTLPARVKMAYDTLTVGWDD